ncbi:MAG: helix-turn-helix domain-containing protein, partial [Candidatus Bipolaricaulota bacterium]
MADQSEIHEVRDRLAELLGLPVDELRVEQEVRLAQGRRADAVIHALESRFVIEIKRSASAASVLGAAEQLQQLIAEAEDGAIPLIVVPYMGEVGQKMCAVRGIAWLDLSGNAVIVAPGLHIRVAGQPNRFKRRGRPRSPFAPKSSRIARWLLLHPQRAMTQRELAEATGVGEGFTSRIVTALEEDGLVVRDEAGRVVVRDPDVLLEAWREDYDFAKH